MTRATPQDYEILKARVAAKMGKTTPDSEDIPDKGSESQLQSKIRDWADKEGYPCLIHPQSKKLSYFLPPGYPDIILTLPFGTTVYFETKAKGKDLSKKQIEMKLMFDFLGHHIHKVRSFKKFLEIVYKIMEKE